MATNLQMIARREFTPLPDELKAEPARVRSAQVRFYIQRYSEHRQAFNLLRSQGYGESPKVMIRALLHYQDSVIAPLEALGAEERSRPPRALRIGVLDFEPVKRPGNKVVTTSIRLYIDQVAEHRKAYEFLQEMQRLRGEGNKTIIKALIHYQRSVLDPLQAQEEK